jgi:hypothetical protein
MAHSRTAAEHVTLSGRMGRGVLAGLVAGAAFALITMWFVTSTDAPARSPFLLISTIVLGENAIETGEATVLIGVLVHAGLSALFGMAFGLVTPRLRTNGTVAVAGLAYGLVLYLLNLRLLAPLYFPEFQEYANQPFEVLVHLLYGGLVGLGFYSSDVRRQEPFLSIG